MYNQQIGSTGHGFAFEDDRTLSQSIQHQLEINCGHFSVTSCSCCCATGANPILFFGTCHLVNTPFNQIMFSSVRRLSIKHTLLHHHGTARVPAPVSFCPDHRTVVWAADRSRHRLARRSQTGPPGPDRLRPRGSVPGTTRRTWCS